MMFVNHPSPKTGVHQTHPKSHKGYGGNIEVVGVMSHQITLMLALSDMAEMNQLTGNLSCLDHWPALTLNRMKSNPTTYGDMDCGYASWGATQGQDKVISGQIYLF